MDCWTKVLLLFGNFLARNNHTTKGPVTCCFTNNCFWSTLFSNQLQELEAILNYTNIELRRLRSSYFKKYLENYQRALSSRDVEKYVDGEPDVVDYEKIINEFALMRNKWLGVLKGLDQKQWQLTNIVKLRVAGMEDASV